jgi:nitroimidazol reductase NimA-like FMN-containing flavoprotein (pyridoxamine 5'-phosphate oxidase superfamily)
MQKKEREVKDRTKIKHLLKKCKYATISMCRGGEPYIVSLNYGFDEDKNILYFHSANLGLKIDIIRENPIVCGTVVEDLGYVNNACSHKYRSIVFWGEMMVVQGIEEKKHGFEVLLNHLEEKPSKMRKKIFKDEKAYYNTSILKLIIKKITGKVSE